MTTSLLEALASRTARVVVMGQGYVGLPVAMRAAEVGFPTLGFDIDARRVASLAAGSSHVGDVSDSALAAALAHRYRVSADPAALAGFDIAVISVPTPLQQSQPDLSAIEGAASLLAPHVRRGCCVVLESTTYPGTTTELVGPILSSVTGLVPGVDFHLGYSPERIDPGNRTNTLVNTPKVVSGVDADSLSVVDAFFGALVDRTVPVSTTAEAEMTKLLENTFRHVNIALVNELAMFAHELGVNVWNAIDAAATKPFGFMKFTPGPGIGGHCIPLDPHYLAWKMRTLNYKTRFIDLASEVNSAMPDMVAHKVADALNDERKALKGSRVLVLGVAYKRDIDDMRESPALDVMRRLEERLRRKENKDTARKSPTRRLRLPTSARRPMRARPALRRRAAS